MRILVVSHEFPPIGGGGANACNYLTKGFHKQGHEVTVITANFRGLPDREIIEMAWRLFEFLPNERIRNIAVSARC